MRVISEQLDLAFANQKTAAKALKTSAQKINTEIAKNLGKSKELKSRYDAVRAGSGESM